MFPHFSTPTGRSGGPSHILIETLLTERLRQQQQQMLLGGHRRDLEDKIDVEDHTPPVTPRSVSPRSCASPSPKRSSDEDVAVEDVEDEHPDVASQGHSPSSAELENPAEETDEDGCVKEIPCSPTQPGNPLPLSQALKFGIEAILMRGAGKSTTPSPDTATDLSRKPNGKFSSSCGEKIT